MQSHGGNIIACNCIPQFLPWVDFQVKLVRHTMHEAMIFYIYSVAARKWPSPWPNLVNPPPPHARPFSQRSTDGAWCLWRCRQRLRWRKGRWHAARQATTSLMIATARWATVTMLMATAWQDMTTMTKMDITNPSKDGTKQNCLCVYIVKVLWSHLVYFQTSKILLNFCVYALTLMLSRLFFLFSWLPSKLYKIHNGSFVCSPQNRIKNKTPNS